MVRHTAMQKTVVEGDGRAGTEWQREGARLARLVVDALAVGTKDKLGGAVFERRVHKRDKESQRARRRLVDCARRERIASIGVPMLIAVATARVLNVCVGPAFLCECDDLTDLHDLGVVAEDSTEQRTQSIRVTSFAKE